MPDAARPRRHEAASAAERIVWPDDFGRRFLVTVDVEEEFDWTAPLDRRHRSTKAMRAFAPAHRRFAEAGVGLNCMVDYPVAVDPSAVRILSECLDDGRSEIGAQLHSWVTPPYQEVVDPFTSHAGNLPIALETAKLDTLTDAIATSFGRRPRIFRSGRYGLGQFSLPLLAARGYRIDSSMRALHDYGATGGMDFSAIDAHGFRRGVLARAGLLNRIPLTPEGVGIRDALAGIDRALADGVRLLTFSFHSPTLEPGHTPYVRDAADRALFDRWWDAVFERLARHGVTATTIEEILAATG